MFIISAFRTYCPPCLLASLIAGDMTKVDLSIWIFHNDAFFVRHQSLALICNVYQYNFEDQLPFLPLPLPLVSLVIDDMTGGEIFAWRFFDIDEGVWCLQHQPPVYMKCL